MRSETQQLQGARLESLAERAALALRAMVHDGVLLPGQPIRQVAIAEQLGISRVPLREALKQLQADGLVETSPSGGFAVTRLSAAELSEIYLMRRLLEDELLRRIETVSAGELARLSHLNERMARLIDEPTRELRSLNREFHFHMFTVCGLVHVVSDVSRLWDRTAAYRMVYSTERLARVRIVEEHAAMIEALRRGDTDTLVTTMDAHRDASQRNVIALLSRPA